MILKRRFYRRDTAKVAQELLGKVLCHEVDGYVLKGKIVETEAYYGENDPGSHAFIGMTPRNSVMYGEAGFSYVYFTYGMHHMLNVVTERVGVAGAVLIRAVEPLEGIYFMKKRRRTDDIRNLTTGPGKLTQAFGIDLSHNGLDLTNGPLRIMKGDKPKEIVRTGRIGINQGKELQLRFCVKDSPFLSRKNYL
ncbi:MAG: DNA-3-methyladenine glycosylase [Candidatus Aenigmatarchaeota archaeon]|nr:MAG: DNA-3-methyladenine glycosylase [Candidatus Aenigmarchaeota archaeon]